MKSLINLLFVIIEINISLGQTKFDSVAIKLFSKNKQDTVNVIEPQRRLTIIVGPEGASNAFVTMIRKTKISIDQYVSIDSQIKPDTIGTMTAPVTSRFSLGKYEINVRKEGFKDIIQNIIINEKQRDSLVINMCTLEYIFRKEQQWRTIKWINAGITVASAIGLFYINNKINTSMDDYNQSTSTEFLKGKRYLIKQNQLYFKITSAIGITGIFGFALSWQIESLY
jgi:hypothetical protein